MAALTRAKKKTSRTDHDRLQGIWSFVAGQRKAELLIAGNHYTVKFRNGDLYMGTIRLAPARKPKHIDMTVEEGPAWHRGKVALGIYRLEGDQLHWSPGEPGAGRPTRFPTLQDRKQLYLILTRELP
jgi:uncharacterized protein (TIGR03067 family)